MTQQVKMLKRQIKTGNFHRTFSLDRATMDEENRTIPLAFSSETPVERWFGKEILSHDPSSVDLGRLNDSGALLFEHDTDDQIGVIESAVIDADKKGRAVVRFGQSAKAEEIFKDVIDGIRKHVSVGYRIHEMLEDKDTNTFTATRWEPYEISMVSIPADTAVGIMRKESLTEENETIILTEERTMSEEIKAPVKEPVKVDTSAIEKQARESAQKDELHRIAEIRAMGEAFKTPEIAETAIKEYTSVNDVRVRIMDSIKDSPAIAPVSEIGLSKKEEQSYSLLRAINASLSNDWKGAEFELECSRTIAGNLNREARGFFVPYEVQKRTMNVATDSAGGYMVKQEPQSMIDYLYANTVIGQMGATYLTGLVGDVPIPKQTGKSSFYWLGEDEDGTNSEPTLGQILLMPKTVAGAVPMTRKLMKQTSPSIEQMVMNDLNRGSALAIDAAALNGSGVDGEPLGVLSATGINTFTITSAGAPDWEEIVGMETAINADNALAGNLGWVMTPAVKGALRQAKIDAGSGMLILDNFTGNIMDYKVATSTQMPTAGILFGDFTSLVVGMWGVMDVMADTSTKAASGGLVLRTFQDVDVGVRHAESFCKNA